MNNLKEIISTVFYMLLGGLVAFSVGSALTGAVVFMIIQGIMLGMSGYLIFAVEGKRNNDKKRDD